MAPIKNWRKDALQEVFVTTAEWAAAIEAGRPE